jgi:hypothetical protein
MPIQSTFDSHLSSATMSAIFDSTWYRCYSRAVHADDIRLRRVYVNQALIVINETLIQGGLHNDELLAISAAAPKLHELERKRLQGE